MKNISIQIPFYDEEIKEACDGLDYLYDWLENSPTGTTSDLFALDFAITVAQKILSQIESKENNNGL